MEVEEETGNWGPALHLPGLRGGPAEFSSLPHPYSARGTHGYMAPEVLQKGVAYDSSADWFSLGCMLFKLLRG